MIDAVLGSLESLLLWLLCGGAVLAAVLMIVSRQPMRVAVALITAMICLGGIYGLLGVHFIAAFQVLIYVGAVMVFMVYVIMLLEMREATAPLWSKLLWPGVIGFVALFGAVLISIWRSLPAASGKAGTTAYCIAKFSVSFLNEYWLQFELTSVLLVAAVVAAMAIIKVERKARHG